MRVVVLQPSYLPWIGAFHQMMLADHFVFLDTVQYTRRDWRNRNRFKNSQGEAQYLSVPVKVRAREHTIAETEIDLSQNWQRKHLGFFHSNYSRSQAFDEIYPFVHQLLGQPWTHIADLCMTTTEQIAKKLDIKCAFSRFSDLEISEQNPSLRLLKAVKALGGKTYLTGPRAKSYLKEDVFTNAGVALEYHTFSHPIYPQPWSNFVPYLSIVDLLFNQGFHMPIEVALR